MSSHGAETSRHIGVLFALPEEAAPFLRLPIPTNVKISVEISGMGIANATAAACKLLTQNPAPGCLIICGFGGGLGYQQAGDLMLVHRVLDTTQTPPLEYCSDPSLLKLATRLRFRLLCGTLATTPRVLITAEEKSAVFATTEANAVDMETAGAARVAQELGVPWIAVRALTDGATDALPFDFNQFASINGQTDRNQVVRATLKNPLKIPALIRLGMRSSYAAKLLAGFLNHYLPLILNPTEDKE